MQEPYITGKPDSPFTMTTSKISKVKRGDNKTLLLDKSYAKLSVGVFLRAL